MSLKKIEHLNKLENVDYFVGHEIAKYGEKRLFNLQLSNVVNTILSSRTTDTRNGETNKLVPYNVSLICVFICL